MREKLRTRLKNLMDPRIELLTSSSKISVVALNRDGKIACWAQCTVESAIHYFGDVPLLNVEVSKSDGTFEFTIGRDNNLQTECDMFFMNNNVYQC